MAFVILFTGIAQAFGEGFFPGFSLAPVGGHTWIALVQDLFDLLPALTERLKAKTG